MKRVLLVFVVVLGAACGLPAEGDGSVAGPDVGVDEGGPEMKGADALRAGDQVLSVPAPSAKRDGARLSAQADKLQQAALVAPGATAGDVVLAVQNATLADGVSVEAAIGLMGCGYFVSARATAPLQGGAATLLFPGAAENQGYGADLFFFEDANGDGACTSGSGDRVFKLPLEAGGSTTLSIDLASTPPVEDWYCFIFAPDYGQ